VVRIAMFLQRPVPEADPRINPVTEEVVARLRGRGAQVDLLVAEDNVFDIAELRPGHDLYVLKSKSPLTLSIAAVLAAAGARVVNSVAASTLARDKIAATAGLAAAGVPVPPSWATAEPARLRPLAAAGPLWLKPRSGSKGQGVRRVAEPADLVRDAVMLNGIGQPLPVFAQCEVPHTGVDLKVYVVGERTWAVAKSWPTRTVAEKTGMPAALSAPIREAALRGGEVLGLEVYGIDFLVVGERFWAVDVNAFPGSRGVPELPAHLADYLYMRALRGEARSLPPAALEVVV
jgi:ribosomal protein S6--L-glutamate ligase